MYATTGEETIQVTLVVITRTHIIYYGPAVMLFDSTNTNIFLTRAVIDMIGVTRGLRTQLS